MDGKIFKISGYLVDPNGENEAAWIWEELRHLNDTFGHHVHVKEADILDWTDENPLIAIWRSARSISTTNTQ